MATKSGAGAGKAAAPKQGQRNLEDLGFVVTALPKAGRKKKNHRGGVRPGAGRTAGEAAGIVEEDPSEADRLDAKKRAMATEEVGTPSPPSQPWIQDSAAAKHLTAPAKPHTVVH